MKLMKKLNVNTKIYLMIMLISLSLLILGGTSYAIVQKILLGEKIYSFQTGNFLVEFVNSDIVTITNKIPVYDNIGIESSDEFSFEVTNTGNYNASYSVKIENNSTTDIASIIRYAINYGDGYSYDNVHALSNNYYVVQNKSLAVGETHSYSLKFWIDIDGTEEFLAEEFSGRLVIEATQDEYKYGTNVLEKVYNSQDKEGLVAVDSSGSIHSNGDVREYRYSGGNPYNYVWFNCSDGYTKGEEYCEKWRIIGSFENTYENGVGTYQVLKIVRNNILSTQKSYTDYVDGLEESIYEGSSLQEYLNNDYFNSLNNSSKKLVLNANWNIGRTNMDKTPSGSYSLESSVSSYNNIGLINVSDYGYALSSNYWNNDFNTLRDYGNNNEATWMYYVNGTLNVLLNGDNADGYSNYIFYADASVGGLASTSVTTSFNIIPSLYLKPDVSIIGGYGTSEEPYELSIMFPMTYGTKTELKVQKVTYNLNGGQGLILSTNLGEALTSEVPIKDGFEFLGWSTSEDAEEAEYQSGDIYNGTDLTLYAVWVEAKLASDIIIKNVVSYEEASTTTFAGGLVAINTEGTLYNETDASQTIREYRYNGLTVNNYIYFNCQNTDNFNKDTYDYASNCETWRIIGVFKDTVKDADGNVVNDENGNPMYENKLKIMRNTLFTSAELPTSYVMDGITFSIENGTTTEAYWNKLSSSSKPYTYWDISGLKYFLNTTEDTNGTAGYLSMLSESSLNLISNTTYYLGNVKVQGSYITNDSTIQAYDHERDGTYIHDNNLPTWDGLVGMLYVSDYGYTASSTYWTTQTYLYETAFTTSWMSNSINHSNEWFMSPSTMATNAATIFSTDGHVAYSYVHNTAHKFRPVLYLNADAGIVSGDGSENTPYGLDYSA